MKECQGLSRRRTQAQKEHNRHRSLKCILEHFHLRNTCVDRVNFNCCLSGVVFMTQAMAKIVRLLIFQFSFQARLQM